MSNRSIFAFVLLVFISGLMAACNKSKDNPEPPPVPEPYQPAQPVIPLYIGPMQVPQQPSFRLTKLVYRDSTHIIRTKLFRYDNLNRLTSIEREETNAIIIRFTYSGDTLKTATTFDRLNNAYVREYPIRISANVDTITLTTTIRGDTGVDTSQLVVIFDAGRLREYQRNYFFRNPRENFSTRYVFSYNDLNNLRLITQINRGVSNPFCTPIAFDRAKNPFLEMSRLLYFFYEDVDMIGVSSANNATRIQLGAYTDEYRYTYNAQGYPATRQLVGEDAWVEFHYAN